MKKIMFLMLAVGFLLNLPLTARAIGQITEPIIINNAQRGQEVSATLTLLNSEKKQNIFGVVAEGQIAAWASFYSQDDKEFKTPIKEIAVPAGAYLDVAVLFKIPADTANGDYAGTISVVYSPSKTSSTTESSSVVAQKISREVKIAVSDKEVINLDASVIPEKFDFKPGEAIKVRIIYDNQSNISLAPSVQVKIKKNEQSVYNVIYPYPESEPAIRSMSLHEIPAMTISTNDLGEGKFFAELDFLKGDRTILTKNFSFSVGMVNTTFFSSWLSYIKDNLIKVSASFLLLIILALALIMAFRKTADSKQTVKQ